MSTLTLRSTKGAPLTNTEMDNNLSNLNNDKLETADIDFALLSGNSLVGTGSSQVAQGNHTHSYEPIDTNILRANKHSTLGGGFDSDDEDLGTVTTGTVTLEVDADTKENTKKLINGGAFTLAPPSTSSSCTILLEVTNNASAGAITTTGFTKVDGAFTTVNGDKFHAFVSKVGSTSYLNIVPLQ